MSKWVGALVLAIVASSCAGSRQVPVPDGPQRRDEAGLSWLDSHADLAPAGKRCQQICLTKDDCPKNFFCFGDRCVQCLEDVHCAVVGVGGGCDTATGLCRLCKADADCFISGVPGAKLRTGACDPAGQCLRCLADTDCAFALSVTKICDPARGSCVTCTIDAHCASGVSSPRRCDLATGTCSRCTTDSQCCSAPGCGQTCDTARGICLCSTDQQCLTGPMAGRYVCK